MRDRNKHGLREGDLVNVIMDTGKPGDIVYMIRTTERFCVTMSERFSTGQLGKPQAFDSSMLRRVPEVARRTVQVVHVT